MPDIATLQAQEALSPSFCELVLECRDTFAGVVDTFAASNALHAGRASVAQSDGRRQMNTRLQNASEFTIANWKCEGNAAEIMAAKDLGVSMGIQSAASISSECASLHRDAQPALLGNSGQATGLGRWLSQDLAILEESRLLSHVPIGSTRLSVPGRKGESFEDELALSGFQSDGGDRGDTSWAQGRGFMRCLCCASYFVCCLILRRHAPDFVSAFLAYIIVRWLTTLTHSAHGSRCRRDTVLATSLMTLILGPPSFTAAVACILLLAPERYLWWPPRRNPLTSGESGTHSLSLTSP